MPLRGGVVTVLPDQVIYSSTKHHVLDVHRGTERCVSLKLDLTYITEKRSLHVIKEYPVYRDNGPISEWLRRPSQL